MGEFRIVRYWTGGEHSPFPQPYISLLLTETGKKRLALKCFGGALTVKLEWWSGSQNMWGRTHPSQPSKAAGRANPTSGSKARAIRKNTAKSRGDGGFTTVLRKGRQWKLFAPRGWGLSCTKGRGLRTKGGRKDRETELASKAGGESCAQRSRTAFVKLPGSGWQ